MLDLMMFVLTRVQAAMADVCITVAMTPDWHGCAQND